MTGTVADVPTGARVVEVQVARDRCIIGQHLAPEDACEVGEMAFAALERVAAGQATTLVNDHGPIPLGHQLETTRGPAHSWANLEQRPTTWRARIARGDTSPIVAGLNSHLDIRLRRVHDLREETQAQRVLGDRVWPRWLGKDSPCRLSWLPEPGDSRDQRGWVGHRPARWAEFRRHHHVGRTRR